MENSYESGKFYCLVCVELEYKDKAFVMGLMGWFYQSCSLVLWLSGFCSLENILVFFIKDGRIDGNYSFV